MAVRLLELTLTPALIAAATLASRRFGAGVGGWLVALPWTSGPVVLFLALDHGTRYAAAAAAGSLAGALGQCAFCVAYGRIARRRTWAGSLAAGSLAFALVAVLLDVLPLRLAPLVAVLPVALAASARLLGRGGEAGQAALPRRFELPLRMAVGTALVLAVTGLASTLGPRASGLLATYPLITAVLAVFAHREDGSRSAALVLRGLVVGLLSFAGFFAVLHVLLERTGIAPAFAAALAAALLLHAATLAAVRSRSLPAP